MPEEKLTLFEAPEGTLDRDSLDHCFYLEVVKDKQSIGKQPLSKKGCLVFGRSEQVDIPMLHPSLSRQHAVILHMMRKNKDTGESEPGIVVMDLGSANATHINGKKIKPKIQYPIKPDYYFTLGKSTRRYYLRHDPSLKKPSYKAKSEAPAKDPSLPSSPLPPTLLPPQQSGFSAQQGVKRKAPEEESKAPKTTAEIKKLQAKKKRTAVTQSVGARKLVSSQFRSLVDMPRVTATPGAVTLESMASAPQDDGHISGEEAPAAEEGAAEEAEEEDIGDNPEEENEGRSWLFKPDSAVAKRDEDSD